MSSPVIVKGKREVAELDWTGLEKISSRVAPVMVEMFNTVVAVRF